VHKQIFAAKAHTEDLGRPAAGLRNWKKAPAVRGFLLGVLVLVGMDVVLNSPASRVAALLDRPSRWLAAWMDPARPLIPIGHLGETGHGGGGGGFTRLPGGAIKPDTPGKCPKGYLWDPKSKTCLKELA